jgi:hypothetical protein
MIEKDSLVVVAGKFLRVGIKKLNLKKKSSTFKPATSGEKSTHKSGGHLDNFWTIIDIIQAYFIEKFHYLSRHALFIITLNI